MRRAGSYDPFARLPPDAVTVSSLVADQGDDLADGWVHEKLAPATIVAIVLRGRYEVQSGDRRTMIDEGEAFLAQDAQPLRIVHHGRRRGEAMRAHWLHVRFMLFHTIDLISLSTLPDKLDARSAKPFGVIIRELRELQAGRRSAPSVELHARKVELAFRVLGLLGRCSRLTPAATTLLERGERLAPALAFIDSHLAERLTVTDLARAARLSRSQLFEHFHEHLGRSPMEYVKEVRLGAARRQLMASDAKVSAVAEAVGFADAFHLSREFKRRYGIPPSEFREQQRRTSV